MPSASCNSDVSAKGVRVLHDQRCYIVLHFDLLGLRSEIVPLTVLLASYDADASANVTYNQNNHVGPDFDCLNVRSIKVPLTLLMTPCDANISVSGIT